MTESIREADRPAEAEPLTLGDLVEPCEGRLVVEVEVKAERTPSGLYIPEETARTIHEERPTQGRVVAVTDDEDDFEVGDWVIFGKYNGTKLSRSVEVDGKREREVVIVLNAKDVLAKLRSPEQVRGLKVRS